MKSQRNIFQNALMIILMIGFSGCENDDDFINETDNVIIDNGDNGDNGDNNPDPATTAVVLVIDEESIDNGNEPNNFSESDVNDNLAEIGLRQTLRYFRDNIGDEIVLYTGQVGDEGWFTLKTIPDSWETAGPTGSGLRNFLLAGPGLGENENDDLLDEVNEVIPLRATGLAMLTGQTVIAVVYDSDISINYDPIEGDLQGENLGIVAFEVLSVTERTDGSDSDLPSVRLKILNADEINDLELNLFSNVPIPESSSEPKDTVPASNIPAIELSPAE
ncbi:MAG: hypothetical protein ACQEQB_08565 [Bacteroidota bacterium]